MKFTKLIAGLSVATVVVLATGCEALPVDKVPAQIVGDAGCYSETPGANGVLVYNPSACRDAIVEDVYGNQKQLHLSTTARPGQWVELNCFDVDGQQKCGVETKVINNTKRLKKLKAESIALQD